MSGINKPQETEAEIRAGMPHLDKFEAYHNKILVGIYMGPEKTPGGIIRPDSHRDEDKWQGKCGVVLKKGPLAFVSDGINEFKNEVDEGDWIVFRVSDGFPIDIEGVHCRLIEDSHVQARVPDPKLIY